NTSGGDGRVQRSPPGANGNGAVPTSVLLGGADLPVTRLIGVGTTPLAVTRHVFSSAANVDRVGSEVPHAVKPEIPNALRRWLCFLVWLESFLHLPLDPFKARDSRVGSVIDVSHFVIAPPNLLMKTFCGSDVQGIFVPRQWAPALGTQPFRANQPPPPITAKIYLLV